MNLDDAPPAKNWLELYHHDLYRYNNNNIFDVTRINIKIKIGYLTKTLTLGREKWEKNNNIIVVDEKKSDKEWIYKY